MKRAQHDSAQLSRTGRALLAAGTLTVIIGLAALFIPPLIGVPIVPETFYDGVIGAVAAALIAGAYAVGITLYVLRRSLDQQAALHEVDGCHAHTPRSNLATTGARGSGGEHLQRGSGPCDGLPTPHGGRAGPRDARPCY